MGLVSETVVRTFFWGLCHSAECGDSTGGDQQPRSVSPWYLGEPARADCVVTLFAMARTFGR